MLIKQYKGPESNRYNSKSFGFISFLLSTSKIDNVCTKSLILATFFKDYVSNSFFNVISILSERFSLKNYLFIISDSIFCHYREHSVLGCSCSSFQSYFVMINGIILNKNVHSNFFQFLPECQ